MLLYTCIMALAGGSFVWLGMAIGKGRVDLIHDYHQTKVSDKKAYGRAFSKALFVIAAAMLVSSIIGLFENLAPFAVWVLIIGLCVGTVCIAAVQIKYNKGIF